MASSPSASRVWLADGRASGEVARLRADLARQMVMRKTAESRAERFERLYYRSMSLERKSSGVRQEEVVHKLGVLTALLSTSQAEQRESLGVVAGLRVEIVALKVCRPFCSSNALRTPATPRLTPLRRLASSVSRSLSTRPLLPTPAGGSAAVERETSPRGHNE